MNIAIRLLVKICYQSRLLKMKIIRTIKEMQQEIQVNKEMKIGYVPTMGFIHEGHLSLVEEAKKENDLVVMSIFVNPLQFGPNEDFDRYPRNEEQDQQVAEETGVDILFLPDVKEMYPANFAISMQITSEQVNVLCGRSRPGHFDGVITVLTKLFNIVQPDNAYFGLKDAQQFAVVDTLINHLNFPINLVGLPTIREEDGLAKSSRNVYLSDTERKEALALSKALKHAQQLIVDGINNPVTIISEVKKCIMESTSGKIDYVEVLNFPNLSECTTINGQIIIALAVHFERARLIDNFILNEDGSLVNRIN